ncbi:glycosyltransferase family 2 protein [Candidatus Daviesbacteria bacterium]|nr:glycosyltransferase family 2 protein [Candidatus Daviesbacteria bacterium]
MKRGQLVSVIITTKNEEKVISRVIKSVKEQTYRQSEIIIVDNYSTDKTVEVVEKKGVAVYSFGPERSSQRNFGAKHARGDYLLFVDADMELCPGVLMECVEVCKKGHQVGAIIIPERSIGRTFWEKVKAFERSFYNLEGDNFTDAARFFVNKAFVMAGGYDEKITGPEDWDLPESVRKLGFNIGRIQTAIYHHERIASPFELARKKFYYALRSHRYLSKQKISVIGPKTIYFLRPVFYKHFDKILSHPVLSLGMIFMFVFELIGDSTF